MRVKSAFSSFWQRLVAWRLRVSARLIGASACLFMSLVLLPELAWAQDISAGIRGTVSDPTAAVIPGAEVSVVGENTGLTRAAVTDDAGRYTFTLLPVGSYRLAVQKSGFKRYEQKGITLTTNQVLGLNPVLEVGEVSQTVEVTGQAPLVNTSTSDVSTLVDSNQIKEMPLNGRNIIQLATLTAGVSYARIETVVKSNPNDGGNKLAVNGNLVSGVQFNLDGADVGDPRFNFAMNYPNPDALQEFRFITSNYSAEFGKNPGGVLNAVIKSGTNQIRGSLWEFNRNSALGARDFFQPTRGFRNQNQFGGSVGGPAVKDKLFWFGSVQWLRLREPRSLSSAFPPTAAERAGDFSARTTPIIDPLTGLAFPGNIIPTARFDPVAATYLQYLPLPNSPDGRWVGSIGEPTNDLQFTVKSDYEINQKNRLSVSLFWDDSKTLSPVSAGESDLPYAAGSALGDWNQVITVKNKQPIVNYTYTFGPNLMNNFRFAFQRLSWRVTGNGKPTIIDMGADVPTATFEQFGITRPGGPPHIGVGGRFTKSRGYMWWLDDKKTQVADNVSYIKGAHQLKFGFEFEDMKMDHLSSFGADPIFIATGGVTGDTLADFMLGRMFAIFSNVAVHSGSQRQYSGYVLDDLKVTRNLTLNLGLRYYVAPNWIGPEAQKMADGSFIRGTATWIEGQQSQLFKNAPVGFVYPPASGFAGDPGVPASLAFTDKNNFAPRVGLAWDITGDGKTSLRAGWGVFYGAKIGVNSDHATINPPMLPIQFIPVTDSLVDPIPAATKVGFPVKLSPDMDFTPFLPANLRAMDRFNRDPLSQQFNLTIQRQFPGALSLQAAYVGNVYEKGIVYRDLNSPLYIPGASTFANVNDRRPFNAPYLPTTPYGEIAILESSNRSAYHSLQLQAIKRFSRGLSFLSSYTWSKTIDYCSGASGNGTTGITDCAIQNARDLRAERGLSGIHQAQRWVTSFNYNTPSLSRAVGNNNPVVRHIFDDWQLAGILSFRSGRPFTVFSGLNYSYQGGADRPNLVGDPHLSTSRPRSQLLQEYFNTAAFAPNATEAAPGTFGNAGRNILISPGAVNVDMAVYKNILVTENKKLQLRFEFFNLPNRPNFGEPVANLQSGANGRILSTDPFATPARIIQLGAKLDF